MTERKTLRQFEQRKWKVPDDVQTVRGMLQTGSTFDAIATHFNVSRNAVASFIRRRGMVGMSKHGGRVTKKPEPAPAPKVMRLPVVVPAPKVLRLPVVVPMVEAPALFLSSGVSFADMDMLRQCNWIIADNPKQFCGAGKPPSRGQPYCAHHAAKAYVPRQPRQTARW